LCMSKGCIDRYGQQQNGKRAVGSSLHLDSPRDFQSRRCLGLLARRAIAENRFAGAQVLARLFTVLPK
jgi:hypothetical protein